MKKIILAILATSAIGTTLSAPFVANAHPFKSVEEDHAIGFRDLNSNSYEVLYRRNNRSSWQFHAYYANRFEAEKSAFRLRLDGYRTLVQHARG
jgi:hypothetical protein